MPDIEPHRRLLGVDSKEKKWYILTYSSTFEPSGNTAIENEVVNCFEDWISILEEGEGASTTLAFLNMIEITKEQAKRYLKVLGEVERDA